MIIGCWGIVSIYWLNPLQATTIQLLNKELKTINEKLSVAYVSSSISLESNLESNSSVSRRSSGRLDLRTDDVSLVIFRITNLQYVTLEAFTFFLLRCCSFPRRGPRCWRRKGEATEESVLLESGPVAPRGPWLASHGLPRTSSLTVSCDNHSRDIATCDSTRSTLQRRHRGNQLELKLRFRGNSTQFYGRGQKSQRRTVLVFW